MVYLLIAGKSAGRADAHWGLEKGMGIVKGLIKRSAAVLAVSTGLGACGGISEGGMFDSSFWDSGPLFMFSNDRAELGLAEMAKGNYTTAETHFKKALAKDGKDIHALLGLGVLYQNTGQLTKAREMYESILAIRPDQAKQFMIWKNLSTMPIAEIASVNLALLESGGVLESMGREPTGPQSMFNQPVAPGFQPPQGVQPAVSGAPANQAMLGRSTPARAGGPAARMGLPGVSPGLSPADVNIASRFRTIVALRDQGLITQGEFDTRRQANIGALLPLTSPPPAAGMDRSVPSPEQISGRLRAIGRGLEMRALTVSQHSAERSMILDALMPEAPVSVANPGMPPRGLMEAADAVRRLELLSSEGLITTDEYAQERLAIEGVMQPVQTAPRPAAGFAQPSSPAKLEGAKARPSGPQAAVHLASYRSRKAADRGWAQLRRAHKELLGGFDSEVTKVNLGPGKGIFYRLKAGPVENKTSASAICRKLKRRRQYCEPSFMNAG